MASCTFNQVLQVYLTVLGAVEMLIIARLNKGEPLPAVVPAFTTAKGPAFTHLFCFLAVLLLLIRTSTALSIDSAAAWRTAAGAHVAEALYIISIAFGASGERPSLPPQLRDVTPAQMPALAFVGIVAANAGLFVVVWLAKYRAERAAAAAARARMDKARVEAKERRRREELAAQKVVNDARVAAAAEAAATTALD